MKTFQEWLKVYESMDVYIQGYDTSNDMHDLDDVANKLKIKILYPMFEKLSPEAQEAVRKGGSMMHGMITPDGSYYSGEGEVINFYSAGWPQELIPHIIQGIKYFLDEMGIKYGQFRTEQSGMNFGQVYRIPVLKFEATKGGPPVLNLSNQNAFLIFKDILGFYDEGGHGFYGISPAELLMKIDNLPDFNVGIHAQEPYTTKTQGGPTVHHGGLDESGIKRRLEQIRQIAIWARDNGYDEIYVT